MSSSPTPGSSDAKRAEHEVARAKYEADRVERQEREVEELIQKVREAKSEALEKLLTLGTCAEALRQHARRNSTDMSGALVMFATAHMRIAGAATQGIQRTGSIDRLIDRAKSDRIEEIRFEEERLVRENTRNAREKARQQVDRLTFPVDNDAIDELYGEVDSDAQLHE
jgi:hypothetical protein